MSVHSYGRSLQLAVSRHPQSYHFRTISSSTSKPQAPNPKVVHSFFPQSSSRVSAYREDHPNKTKLQAEKLPDNNYISEEDRRFLWAVKSGNLKSDVRKRIYSAESIIKPNSYDILAVFSRKHSLQRAYEDIINIPAPPTTRSHRASLAEETPAPTETVVKEEVEQRDLVKAENHHLLFTSIDKNLVQGPKDWPATYYLAACAAAYGTLDDRVRTASISYLVTKFILGGKQDDILRLYTEIQNSWLPVHQRELDALEYFKALFKSLVIKPTSSGVDVTRILDAFSTASSKFTLRDNRGFREEIAPHLLLFLSRNLPLRDSIPAISAQLKNVTSPRNGTYLIPLLFKHLNSALIHSQNLQTGEFTSKQLVAFYIAQSDILQLISQIPRTAAVGIELAKVILSQAVTWEEILEAKRLILDSHNPSHIVHLQTSLFKAIQRVSYAVEPGSMRAKSIVEFMTNIYHLVNYRGEPTDKGISIGIGAAVYARLGYYTAIKRLLNRVESDPRDIYFQTRHVHEMIRGLASSMVRKEERMILNIKGRVADIAMRVWRIHIQRTPVNEIPQALHRDLVSLLQRCNSAVGIREVWDGVISTLPLEKIKLRTFEAFIEGFWRTGDAKSARGILDVVRSSGKVKVSASMLRPFLISPKEGVLGYVVKAGIDHDVEWGSLARFHALRLSERMDEEGLSVSDRDVEVWAEAIQGCADEVVWTRQGRIWERTMDKAEKALEEE
ncbi:hypothetical protein TWF694_000606 [Orbilia ellipsospora]|uniref:Uncharacterized protein n=1 Tax=Orbilia ellipsospora TaxID=2528407 RepID=A0AAV9XRP4_9PEZI